MILPQFRKDLDVAIEDQKYDDEAVPNPNWQPWGNQKDRYFEGGTAAEERSKFGKAYWSLFHHYPLEPWEEDQDADGLIGIEQLGVAKSSTIMPKISNSTHDILNNTNSVACIQDQGDGFWLMVDAFVGLNQLLICLTAGFILGWILSRCCCKSKDPDQAQRRVGVGNENVNAPNVIDGNAPPPVIVNMRDRDPQRQGQGPSSESSSSNSMGLGLGINPRPRISSPPRARERDSRSRTRRWRETSSRIRAEFALAGNSGRRARIRVNPATNNAEVVPSAATTTATGSANAADSSRSRRQARSRRDLNMALSMAMPPAQPQSQLQVQPPRGLQGIIATHALGQGHGQGPGRCPRISRHHHNHNHNRAHNQSHQPRPDRIRDLFQSIWVNPPPAPSPGVGVGISIETARPLRRLPPQIPPQFLAPGAPTIIL